MTLTILFLSVNYETYMELASYFYWKKLASMEKHDFKGHALVWCLWLLWSICQANSPWWFHTPKQLFFATTFSIIVPTIFISTTIYYIILLYHWLY